MAYRDEKEALKARVDTLEQELEHARGNELTLFPQRTKRQKRARIALAVSVVAVIGGGGFLARALAIRAVDREIAASWSEVSACLVGEPLAPNETASSRVRRVSLAYATEPGGQSIETRWPQRCEGPARQLHNLLHDNGRSDDDPNDPSRVAESLAGKAKIGVIDEPFFTIVDLLWSGMQKRGVVAAASAKASAPSPASPLHLADLAGAAVTKVFTPMTSFYVETLVGPDRHVLIAPPEGATVLCSLTAKTGALACRELPGELAKRRDLRLAGTADAGALPLVFAGHEGEGGIFRSDTGERLAAVRAYSSSVAADGSAAIQTWPSEDGSFDVYQQGRPGAEVTKGTVKPGQQKQPVTHIHRSRLLWDKLVLQLVDKKHLETSPWIAVRTLPQEGIAGAFPRVADLNWVNTQITGCKGDKGMVVRVGPQDAMLLFFDGERWQGPLPARGLGELVCDGSDGMFLSAHWPVRVKRCSAAGCDDLTQAEGQWRVQPKAKLFASDFANGNLVAAWITEQDGVRFRIGTPAQIGGAPDVIVFDDLVDDKGAYSSKAGASGVGVLAAGDGAYLLIATGVGVRAVRIHPDGKFEPAKIVR